MYEIRKSNIHGKGIFATTDISNGINLGIAFEKNKFTGNPDSDYKRTELGKYVNHSSDANNLELLISNDGVYFVTKKGIKTNEELFVNYSEFPWEGKKVFNYKD